MVIFKNVFPKNYNHQMKISGMRTKIDVGKYVQKVFVKFKLGTEIFV